MKKNRAYDALVKLLLITLLPSTTLQAGFASTDLQKPVEFIVVFDRPVDTSASKFFIARLKTDLDLNGTTAAAAGSIVKGHLEQVDANGKVIASSSGKAVDGAPYRLVFDQIVSSTGRTLSMHALPSKQYSMMNKGKRLRSIEVEAGGMIKTTDNFYDGEAVRLSAGDELVVRINQDRTVRKAPVEEKAQPLAALADPKPSVASAGVKAPDKSARKIIEKQSEQIAEKQNETVSVNSVDPASGKTAEASAPKTVDASDVKAGDAASEKVADAVAEKPTETLATAMASPVVPIQTPTVPVEETKAVASANVSDDSADATFALKPAIPEVKTESESNKVLPESAWIPESESTQKSADAISADQKSSGNAPVASGSAPEGTAALKPPAAALASVSPQSADGGAQIKVKLASEGPSSDRFRVVLRTGLSSETARVGDRAQGILKDDFKIGDTVIAKVGSGIVGRVTGVKESCRWTTAVAAKDKRFQRSATLKIVFDTIITTEGKEIAVGASIPVQENVFLNSGLFKKIIVSGDNEIIKVEPVENSVSPFAGAQATFLKMAATAGMGPLGIVAMPFIMVGAVGSAEPGLARSFQKTFIAKGDDLYLSPGDEILVRARLCNSDGGQKAVSAKVIDNKSTNSGL